MIYNDVERGICLARIRHFAQRLNTQMKNLYSAIEVFVFNCTISLSRNLASVSCSCHYQIISRKNLRLLKLLAHTELLT